MENISRLCFSRTSQRIDRENVFFLRDGMVLQYGHTIAAFSEIRGLMQSPGLPVLFYLMYHEVYHSDYSSRQNKLCIH